MADMSDFLEVTLLNLSLNGTSWAGMDNPYILYTQQTLQTQAQAQKLLAVLTHE